MAHSSNESEAILKRARDRFDLTEKSEEEIRKEARIDLQFVGGIQWNPEARALREADNRPVITINKLPEFVQQIANNARLNKPSIRITRGDNRSSKDLAEVYEGLIRKIQYASQSEQAWDTALENAANCSMGAVRINSTYAYRSFHQDLSIEPIPDPMAIYFDPGGMKYDRSDGDFAFVAQLMHKDTFKRRWPKAKLVEADFFKKNSPAPGWTSIGENSDFIRVCEYWEVEKFDRNLVMLQDPAQGEYFNEFEDELRPEEKQWIVRDPETGKWMERTETDQRIWQCLTNGVELLPEAHGEEPRKLWGGRYIPLIPVYGKEMWIDGKRKLFSVVRFQRDPQQLYNYYATTEAETISDTPKNPWVGAIGSFKSKFADWRDAALKKLGFLEYDVVVTSGGQIAPPPFRNAVEPPVQALISGKLQCSDEMKAAAGIFDPSLGMQKGDQSGKAIQQLRSEGDIANYHFIDNLARSQWFAGVQLVDLIPSRYDREREIEILGADMEPTIVRINTDTPQVDPKTNKTYHFPTMDGKFDVKVQIAPDTATQREEKFDMVMDTVKTVPPEYAPILIAFAFQFSDIDGADVLVAQMKALLPPAVQAAGQEGGPPQAFQVQMQALSGELAATKKDLKDKLSQQSMKLNTDWRMKVLDVISKLRIAEITASKDADRQNANILADQLQQLLQMGHEANQAAHDRAHEAGMQAHAAALAPEPEPAEAVQ